MSRSGEIFRPCSVISSPVFTITVRSRGSIVSYRPRRSLEAPTPPASAVIFSRFVGGIGRATAKPQTQWGRREFSRGHGLGVTKNRPWLHIQDKARGVRVK